MEKEINLVTNRGGEIYFALTIPNGIITGGLGYKKEDIASALLKIIKEGEISGIKVSSKSTKEYNKFDYQTIPEEDLKFVIKELSKLDDSRKYYLNNK